MGTCLKEKYIRVKTLYISETKRALVTFVNQTIIAPTVNSLVLTMIFVLTIGKKMNFSKEIDYSFFLIMGISMMSAIQGSFANSSSSLVSAKMYKAINNYLIPPIKINEFIFCFAMSSLSRGFAVLLFVYIFSSLVFLGKINLPDFPVFLLVHTFFALLIPSLLGLLLGIICNSFEKLTAIANYIVTPLTFISGTFYSTKEMNSLMIVLNKTINPFFYSINGFRYGISGYTSTNTSLGLVYLILICIIVWLCNFFVLKSGRFTKS